MMSPASGILGSRYRSHRKPLQAKNVGQEPQCRIGVKISQTPPGLIVGKENRFGEHAPGIDPVDTSLEKELGAVRRRRERLRSDRERTEKRLTEMSRILDTAMREAEHRWEAQLKMEAKLRQVIRLRELGPSSSVSSPLRSLRDRAREARMRDADPQVTSNEEKQAIAEERDDGVTKNNSGNEPCQGAPS